jgi:5'-3' exoribonuclease 2
MPASTHIHKSMLLRGVDLPQPELTREDLHTVHNKASNTGRNFGGAPLRDNSGGRINYANPIAQHLNPNFDPGNFARAPPPPHIAAQMGFVPPPPPNWNGPPASGYNASSHGGASYQNHAGYQGNQGYNGHRGNGNQGYDNRNQSYDSRNQGYDNRNQGYHPPPGPPQQQGYNGYSQGGGKDGDRRGGYSNGYRGGRGGRGGGGPRY